MKKLSPERYPFVIFLSRDLSTEAVILLRELVLKSMATINHQRMNSGRPRGPPDATRNRREGESRFSEQQE
ncbi:hypothetical protein SBA2_640024 [Acidobacteriia bacterium SbA2]|nr:hypothetical protein SBA2_640024 [Acidobacteriia bacterium SbA2]